MTSKLLRSSTALILAATILTAPQAFAREELREAIEFAREKVYPALVNISCVTQQHSGGRTQRFPSAGSGAIVSPAGHVLTNFHVAGDTTQIHCTLPNGEVIEADVVAHDPMTDLSILKMRLDQRLDPTQPLPFATLGNSDALDVGQYVLAMGNPLTLSSSLTLGVVSNPSRVFTDFTGSSIDDLDLGGGQMTGMFTRWIQHDALILPGNSGGPLVNLRGEIVGINELGGQGVGFAIPSNLANKVLNQVMTVGEVRRGWIGCAILPVSKIGLTEGVLISSVTPTSPAAKAGLRPGDILLEIDGKKTDVRFFDQVPVFHQMIAEMPEGKKVRVRFLRDTELEPVSCQMTIARMEKFLGEPAAFRKLGLTIRDITGPMALARRYDSTDGVLVTGARAGFPCAEAKPPVRGGDVIRRVGPHEITDLESFKKAWEHQSSEKEFVIEVRRGEASVMTVIELDEDDPPVRAKSLPKAWLGVETQVMTKPVQKAMGLEGTRGFRVTRVMPWTAAAKGGMQIGDVIVEVDGEELDAYRAQDSRDLKRAIEYLPIDEAVEIVVVRDKKRHTLNVTMQKTPTSGSELEITEQDEFEFAVRNIVFMDRINRRWDENQGGALVTKVTSGGWAQIAGLRPSDLIVQIASQSVGNVKEFESAMKAVFERKPKVVPIFVHRGSKTHFVFIEPNWERLAEESKQ